MNGNFFLNEHCNGTPIWTNSTLKKWIFYWYTKSEKNSGKFNSIKQLIKQVIFSSLYLLRVYNQIKSIKRTPQDVKPYLKKNIFYMFTKN